MRRTYAKFFYANEWGSKPLAELEREVNNWSEQHNATIKNVSVSHGEIFTVVAVVYEE